MSVLKRNRKPSKRFEVLHQLTSLRKVVNELIFGNFSYSHEKAQRRAFKRFNVLTEDQLSDDQRRIYEKMQNRWKVYDEFLIEREKDILLRRLSDLSAEVHMANNIYPTNMDELVERRLHQDRAVGLTYVIVQELQYIMQSIPVNVNHYVVIAKEFLEYAELVKNWRLSDNRFKKKFEHASSGGISDSCSAANFANVNNNGNTNYNNASNTNNGVRPRFPLSTRESGLL